MASYALQLCLDGFKQALEAEIVAARRKGGDRYILSDGRELGSAAEGYLYRFRLDRECRVPDDCGITLACGRESFAGAVIAVEDLEIVLRVAEPLPETRRATMVVQLWYILERLRDRLQAIAQDHTRPTQELFDLAGPTVRVHLPFLNTSLPPTIRDLNCQQCRAVGLAQAPGAWFLWGPPGTGKTTTVAQAVALAGAEGRRVLVVAYSNAALDVAMCKIAAAVPESLRPPGLVLRIGTPRADEVRNHPTLTTLAALRHLQPELVERFEALQEERKRLARAGALHAERLEQVRVELETLRAAIRAAEELLIDHARVLGCTLARLATPDALARQRFDLVVLDEASMASVPFAALAASSGQETVLFAGDFRQLPPIFLAEDPAAQHWLGRSIFDHAGMAQRVRARESDPRMVKLTRQYRMHPEISRRVSTIFYDGRLSDDPDLIPRVTPVGRGAPYPNRVVQVVDVSALGPVCLREPHELGFSRFNLVSALVALSLARQARAGTSPMSAELAPALDGRADLSRNVAARSGGRCLPSVGIITPFRAQVRLLGRLAQDLGLEAVRTSTVHRFQGDEVDVAILDLVTAEGYSKLGPLLKGDVWSTAGRLLNVALSRARGKLLVVADLAHLRGRLNATDALHQVLADMEIVRVQPDEFSRWLAGFGVDAGGRPLVERLDHELFAIGRILDPTRDALFLSVADGNRPPVWVKQSARSSARVIIRGQSLPVGWTALENSRVIDDRAVVDAAYASDAWFGLNLPGQRASLLVRLAPSAGLLAELHQIIPQEERQRGQDRVAAASNDRKNPPDSAPLGRCDACGCPYWIDEGRYGPLLRCTGCRRWRKLDRRAATAYVITLKITCPLCRALPEIGEGQRGLYLRCSRPNCDWRQSFRQLV